MCDINTDLRHVRADDLLLWVISHVCEESGEYTADNLISEADENALLICLDEARSTENQ